MRSIFLSLLMCCAHLPATAQVNWVDTATDLSRLEWSNYSTSYIGEGSDSVPLLVTAIPYNGIYDMADRSQLDMDFAGSAFRFRSNLEDRYRKLFTYDPAEVYFMVPGIFASNASQYEFRVVTDDSLVIKPWSNIAQFTKKDFRLNNFATQFAFLGGYKTGWDHYIVLELRKKGNTALTAASVVYWKQARPALVNIFTSTELNDLLLRLKRPYDLSITKQQTERWKKDYSADEIDSVTLLPKKMRLRPTENNLVFFLSADIYKKEALEYRLLKDDNVYRKWGPNEYDNNLISLKDLGPGNYSLQMRYARQRQNISAYPFEIKAAWYQTISFKILAALLLTGFISSVFLLIKLRRQRKKTAAEQAKKEQHLLGLKTIHAQLNPHFIFNALSSIQGLINNNQITAANKYLADFGMLIRHALTDSNNEFIPLEREIATLDTYLKLEQLRFNFSYTIGLNPSIQPAAVEMPALLLQPLVENAVKHGIAGKREEGIIAITVNKEDHDLVVIINDNGAGFDVDQPAEGFGLALTRNRINLLNELMPETFITLQASSVPGNGTTLTLLFKNWLA